MVLVSSVNEMDGKAYVLGLLFVTTIGRSAPIFGGHLLY